MEIINKIPAIVGEIQAGEAKKIRKQLEQLIAKVNNSAFDIAILLHEIRKNGYYQEFGTFTEYIKTLSLKPRKCQYLEKIASTMEELSIPREKYEGLGIAKLREITSLDLSQTWTNPETNEQTPVKLFVEGFIDKGQDMTLDEIKQHVKTLKGLTGEDSLIWLNFSIKQSVLDNTVRPALELGKLNIGSTGKDDDGNSFDPSDGRALEAIAAEYITNPANNPYQELENSDV
jgi:hypothetical protein